MHLFCFSAPFTHIESSFDLNFFFFLWSFRHLINSRHMIDISVKNSMNLLEWMIHDWCDLTHTSHHISLAQQHSVTPTQQSQNISRKCITICHSKWKMNFMNFQHKLHIYADRFFFRYQIQQNYCE